MKKKQECLASLSFSLYIGFFFVFFFIYSSSHSISQVKCSCKIGENESRLYPQGL